MLFKDSTISMERIFRRMAAFTSTENMAVIAAEYRQLIGAARLTNIMISISQVVMTKE